jgi:hypothetical protein
MRAVWRPQAEGAGRETRTGHNEAKTKRNRFASEIVCFAKPLISLSPENAGFRGFQ